MEILLDTTKLKIGNVFSSGKKGQLIAKITKDGYTDCELKPITTFRVPFPASNYEKNPDANRFSLQLSLDDEFIKQEIQKFEAWIIDQLVENSEQYFKKKLTRENILAGFVSCIKESKNPDVHAPLIKVKYDREGKHALFCWDALGKHMPTLEHLDDWRGCRLRVRLVFSHVWFATGQHGVALRMTDCKILSDAPTIRQDPF